MREGLSFEKESPSCAVLKKADAGLIYRLHIKLCASEAMPKRPIGLFSFVIKKSPSCGGHCRSGEYPSFSTASPAHKTIRKNPVYPAQLS